MRICPYCHNPLSSEENEQRIYDRCIIRVGQLEGENEELRELVRDMWQELLVHGYKVEKVMHARYDRRMRELGVE